MNSIRALFATTLLAAVWLTNGFAAPAELDESDRQFLDMVNRRWPSSRPPPRR